MRSLLKRLFGTRRYTPKQVGVMLAEQRADAFLEEHASIDQQVAALAAAGSPLATKALRQEVICFCCFADWFAFMFHDQLEGKHDLLEPLLESYTARVAERMYAAGLWSIRASLRPEGIGPLEGGFHEQFYTRSEAYHTAVSRAGSSDDVIGRIVQVGAAQIVPGRPVPDEVRHVLKETLEWFVTSNHNLVDGLRIVR